MTSSTYQKRKVSVGERRKREGKSTNVAVLLLLRDGRGLTEVGREAESLADGLGVLVRVLLLNVGRSTLEFATGNATGNETVTADNTDGLAVGEDLKRTEAVSTSREEEGKEKTNIEKSSLSGSGGTHERGKLTGTNETVDVVEKLAVTSGNGNSVAVREQEKSVTLENRIAQEERTSSPPR
jgi:hypothetical protein